jgi:DNA-binding beta-propeller fold protein YncE
VLQTINVREAVHDQAMPYRLAVSGAGDVYVADRVSSEVYRLDASGRFVDRFGGRGDRPDHLRSPADLAVDGRGRLYVSDVGDGIKVFDAGGHYLDAFGGARVVFGLAVTDRDELYAAYRNDHQVVKFRLPG